MDLEGRTMKKDIKEMERIIDIINAVMLPTY